MVALLRTDTNSDFLYSYLWFFLVFTSNGEWSLTNPHIGLCLGAGRKPENVEETHTATTQGEHAYTNSGSNLGLWVITVPPPTLRALAVYSSQKHMFTDLKKQKSKRTPGYVLSREECYYDGEKTGINVGVSRKFPGTY